MALKKAMKEIEQNEMKKDYKNKYNNLAPINTLSQDDVYIQALNWAFNDSSIKNIALTGPYGAGKSSILLSFLKQYDNIRKNTLTISLASFIDKLQENQDKNSTEDKTIRLDICNNIRRIARTVVHTDNRYSRISRLINRSYASFSVIWIHKNQVILILLYLLKRILAGWHMQLNRIPAR